VPGPKVEDWEAIAVGPCPSGSCIFLGDIGDNEAKRRDITIRRVPEPADASGSATGAEVFRARYPDGAHDAETLLVTPTNEILIVTKGNTGPVRLYRLPSDAKPGGTATLQPIGKPRQGGKTADERITDGAVSPSGAWVALRTNTAVLLYRTTDLMSGNWREASRLSLKELGEPQGEGIAFGDEKTVYLVGEGGGKSQPGTFGRLTCAL
jgi:WD40 repeat protein